MPPRSPDAAKAGVHVGQRRRGAHERRHWTWIAQGLRRARDLFPFTPLGLTLTAGAAGAVGYFGLARVDLILLVVGGVLIGVCALTVTTVVVVAAALRVLHRSETTGKVQSFECGLPARTGFTLPSCWFVPLVQISWSWVEPSAEVSVVRQRGRLLERVTPLCRARLERVVRRVEVSDPFGIAKLAFELRQPERVRVLPACGALRQLSVARSMAAGDEFPDPSGEPLGDRADLRRYAPGDPMRYVLWKVFARSRQTFVRIPERAVSPGLQTLAYLVAGRGDEPSAAAARVAVESRALGEHWTLGADGSDEEASARERALDLVAASAHVAPELGAAGLALFLERSRPGPRRRVLVFVPAQPGPWLERVSAALRKHGRPGSQVHVVLAVDGVSPGGRRRWLSRFAVRPHEPHAGQPQPPRDEELRRVITELTAARASVLLVDRAAGRVYGRAHQRAMGAA